MLCAFCFYRFSRIEIPYMLCILLLVFIFLSSLPISIRKKLSLELKNINWNSHWYATLIFKFPRPNSSNWNWFHLWQFSLNHDFEVQEWFSLNWSWFHLWQFYELLLQISRTIFIKLKLHCLTVKFASDGFVFQF